MKKFSSLLSGVVLCTVLVPAASMAAGQASINQREQNQQANRSTLAEKTLRHHPPKRLQNQQRGDVCGGTNLIHHPLTHSKGQLPLRVRGSCFSLRSQRCSSATSAVRVLEPLSQT